MSKKSVRYLLITTSVLIILALISFNLNSLITNKKVLGAATQDGKEELINEESFWKGFLFLNPGYLPGIIELAGIERDLGNFGESNKLFSRAKKIDPNWDAK